MVVKKYALVELSTCVYVVAHACYMSGHINYGQYDVT